MHSFPTILQIVLSFLLVTYLAAFWQSSITSYLFPKLASSQNITHTFKYGERSTKADTAISNGYILKSDKSKSVPVCRYLINSLIVYLGSKHGKLFPILYSPLFFFKIHYILLSHIFWKIPIYIINHIKKSETLLLSHFDANYSIPLFLKNYLMHKLNIRKILSLYTM